MAKHVDIVFGRLAVSGSKWVDQDEDDGADTLAQKIHAITNIAVTIHSVSVSYINVRWGMATIVWADA